MSLVRVWCWGEMLIARQLADVGFDMLKSSTIYDQVSGNPGFHPLSNHLECSYPGFLLPSKPSGSASLRLIRESASTQVPVSVNLYRSA
jgi:hypothetical protein